MMSKTFCYEEVCGIRDKIHVLPLFLGVLAVSTVIVGVILANAAVMNVEFLNIPFLPLDF